MLPPGLCSAVWHGRIAPVYPCWTCSMSRSQYLAFVSGMPTEQGQGTTSGKGGNRCPSHNAHIPTGMCDTGWFSCWLAAHRTCVLSRSCSVAQVKLSLEKLLGSSSRKAQRESSTLVSVLIVVKPLYYSLDTLQCYYRQQQTFFCHSQVLTWALNSRNTK